jgi:hypothetical protein
VNWFAMRSPFRGEGSYSLVVCQGNQIRSELYIDHRDPDRVTAIFAALERRKSDIEQIYGEPLRWEQLAMPQSRRDRGCAVFGIDFRHDDRAMEVFLQGLGAG